MMMSEQMNVIFNLIDMIQPENKKGDNNEN